MIAHTEGLGWWPSLDLRRLAYPMRELRAESDRTWRYHWDNGAWLDQGTTPACVGYGWAHWLEDGPITHAPRGPGASPLIVDPMEIYREAQKLDPWPGEDYPGTSSDAGAKVLQNLGLIGEYRWAFSLDEVLPVLLEVGPVGIGSWWWTGMDEPDRDGIIRPVGHRRGGHFFIVNGVNTDRHVARIKNSWGRGWGDKGRAWIDLEDLDQLIREGGEAVIATEVPTDG